MKKLLFLPLIIVLVLTTVIFWFYLSSQAPSTDPKFADFLITKGSSAMQVGNNLAKQGLIKSPIAYKIYVQFTGKSGKIPSGEFRLSENMNLYQIVEQLLKGPVELWVTIPEGLRREEIALRFKDALKKNDAFVDSFILASQGKEGTLFPETYLFPKDVSASAIVAKMTSTYNSKTASLVPVNTNLSNYEILTLASLIERETKTNEERPIVAGIMMNRLSIGMALQIDAAVQYAVGTSKNWWPILTRDDLASTSKYNTYKYPGIPPSPIASPGLASIKAAFAPTDSDYWYYIHDPKGQIHYAKTLSEHNANIAKYLGK